MPGVWLLGRTSAASTPGRSYRIQSVSCVQGRPGQRSHRKLKPLMVTARTRRGIWPTPFGSRILVATKDATTWSFQRSSASRFSAFQSCR